jgi:hypothetical protein
LILTTHMISNIEVNVEVGTDGTFYIRHENENLAVSKSLDQALKIARIGLAKAKVRVNVPYYTREGEPGVATGIHSSNRNILTMMGAVSEQIKYSERMLRGNTPKEQISELVILISQVKALEGRIRDIRTRYDFNLRAAVEEAIKNAQEEAREATS